jgi:hypothetical protein
MKCRRKARRYARDVTRRLETYNTFADVDALVAALLRLQSGQARFG